MQQFHLKGESAPWKGESQDCIAVFTGSRATSLRTGERAAEAKAPLHCIAIADGMGGLDRGADASQTAMRALGDLIQSGLRDALERTPLRRTGALLESAMRQINEAVVQENEPGEFMGTTLTVVLLPAKNSTRAWLMHAGDTEAHLLPPGTTQSRRLSRIHNGPDGSHTVTQFIGCTRWAGNEAPPADWEAPPFSPQCMEFTMKRGSWLLLHSDGIHPAHPAFIAETLLAETAPMESKATELFLQGGDDATLGLLHHG